MNTVSNADPEKRSTAPHRPEISASLERELPVGSRAGSTGSDARPMRLRGADGNGRSSADSASDAQACLHAALRMCRSGVVVWRCHERRIQWDDSLLCLIGRSRQELEARGVVELLDLIHEDDRAVVRAAAARALLCGEPLEIECRLLRAEGVQLWLAVKSSLAQQEHDDRPCVVFSVVDVTHIKQLEADLRQAQKLDTIGQVAGGVAHDLNNLLAIILAKVFVLEREQGLSEPLIDSVLDIGQAAKRGAALTRQLLTFARHQLIQARSVDLNDAIAETLRMLSCILGASIALAFEPASTPVMARVDSSMLSQLVLNLIVNARDAMASGGRCTIRTAVEVLDEVSAAAIHGAKPGRWACVSVVDNGSGIAPNVLARLFEPFFTTKAKGSGTGLGLSIVSDILKQHGGCMQVESVLGRGSAFHAYLPCADED
jgi:two-component system cell cycle sensor histidine kinase/response regulator CckA